MRYGSAAGCVSVMSEWADGTMNDDWFTAVPRFGSRVVCDRDDERRLVHCSSAVRFTGRV